MGWSEHMPAVTDPSALLSPPGGSARPRPGRSFLSPGGASPDAHGAAGVRRLVVMEVEVVSP